MYADPLTISPDNLSSVSTNMVTFDVTEASGKMRKRLNPLTTISDPELMVVNHFQQGSEQAGNLADRHLLQFSRSERDAAGKASLLVVNTTVLVPRNGLFALTDVRRLFNWQANFLSTSTNLERLLTGQS